MAQTDKPHAGEQEKGFPPLDEILLSHGTSRALVSSFGGSLRGLWQESGKIRRDILWGYSGSENKIGGQGDVLFPFPGRISQGTYSFLGEGYNLEKTDKAGPNAIHGFVRSRSWIVPFAETSKVTFQTQILTQDFASKGFPFSLELKLTYTLDETGLRCDFEVENIGDDPAPVGLGFHPYFTFDSKLIDDSWLEMSAERVLEFDDNLLPTGKILPVENLSVDFRSSRKIGQTLLNHCFTDLERDSKGIARLCLKNPGKTREVQIWMDENFPYLVAYTGDALGKNARKSIALEPMTCGTDAFNRPEWGLKILKPKALWSGGWGINYTPLLK